MNRFQTIPRFTVTYGLRDFSVALSNVFTRIPPPPTGLDALFPHSWKFWTSSGRQGLWLMLKGLNLPPRAGVAVPLYSDAAVFQTVRACNLTPVFVDIDGQTLTMSPASLATVRSRISAVIAIHLFGHVAAIPDLQRAAPGVPLIEDTVHAPLSFLGTNLAGTMGVGCFFSMGSSKCWPAGGGGIAVVNDEELAAKVRRQSADLAPQRFKSRIWNVFCQAAKSALFRKPMYGAMTRALRPGMERYAMLEPELDLLAIQPSQAAVALHQIKSYGERVEGQRNNSYRLLAALRDVPDIVLPYERPGSRYNYHFFPVLVSNAEERDAIAQTMLEKSVDTSRVYHNVVSSARQVGYSGDCPVSESAPQRMLTLPNYSTLSAPEVDYIAETFIGALEAYRAKRRPNTFVIQAIPRDPGMEVG